MTSTAGARRAARAATLLSAILRQTDNANVKRVWFAAAAIFAAPMWVGGQQQTPNPRAGFPCGARLDPSYFRVAEGSGGHLLLLAPEEIGDSAALLTAFGDHPQTIFRLAGSMNPGLHEFNVPIDSTVDSVLFSISVQCLQTADVVRPSGALAIGDDVTDLPNFRAQHMVIVRRPEPGVWTLRLAGSGISGVVVQARSGIGISRPEFTSAADTAFSAVPSAGIQNTLRLRMSGRASGLRVSLVSGQFMVLAELPLTAGETDGSYVSQFTPNTEAFRVLVTGNDAAGFAFQRMSAPLVNPKR
jgi:hypothetical protein